MTWRRFAGRALVDGPGFDFDGLITLEGDDAVIRRRDDEDNGVQRVPVQELIWLLRDHLKGNS